MVRPTVQVLKTAFKSMAVGIGQSKRRLTTKMERSNQGPRTDVVPIPPRDEQKRAMERCNQSPRTNDFFPTLCGLVALGVIIFDIRSMYKELEPHLQDLKIKLKEQSKQNEDGIEA